MDEQIFDDDDRLEEHFTVHNIYMKIAMILTPKEMGFTMIIHKNKEIPTKAPPMNIIFENALYSNKINKDLKKNIIYHLNILSK